MEDVNYYLYFYRKVKIKMVYCWNSLYIKHNVVFPENSLYI